MAPDADRVFEALAVVIDSVRDSAPLQTWFRELGYLSEGARRNAILRATQDMKARGEREDVVVAFGLLADPRLFQGVVTALRDCGVSIS